MFESNDGKVNLLTKREVKNLNKENRIIYGDYLRLQVQTVDILNTLLILDSIISIESGTPNEFSKSCSGSCDD